jgi:hypothetical protein
VMMYSTILCYPRAKYTEEGGRWKQRDEQRQSREVRVG